MFELLLKYRGVIDAALKLLEEISKQTETTADDKVSAHLSRARAIFDQFFGGQVTEMALIEEQAAILPILLGSPTLLQILLQILQLFRK